MPWPRSSVPKFGNWDKSEDLSYSIVFDKARAEKERFLHIPDDGFPSIHSFYKNSNVDAGKKALFPDKARADRERNIPTSEQDKTCAHMPQNVLPNPEVTAGRGASHAPAYNASYPSGVPSKFLPTSEQDKACAHMPQNVLPNPKVTAGRGASHAPAYNASHPSGVPSRQPLQAGATKGTTFFNERQHFDQADTGFHGRLHTKSTNTPGRSMNAENPPIAKIRSSQGGLETSRIAADMQKKHSVPKFGDWDSGDAFTAAFNKARNEKSTKYALHPGVKAFPILRTDEDLYKSSETSGGLAERNKRRGWFSMICCSEPLSQ